MSFRSWVTFITLILLGLVIYFGWPEITQAFGLFGKINPWIWSLLIPVQLFSYYATGGMIFSYLRSKGNLKTTSHWQMTRMALELNFVNHIMPSGGAAGFSYLGWVLSRHGVRPGRATMAQIIRFALTFISFVLILVVAVIGLTLDHQINRTIIVISIVLALAAVGGTALAIYIIG
ncbi:flippase-like domain-containing protein, partial [Candidatus Saccharibacteria bacterium]|nr:flippase-like domain-containing protein [Candidatus Saccharibacteria bacterium]